MHSFKVISRKLIHDYYEFVCNYFNFLENTEQNSESLEEPWFSESDEEAPIPFPQTGQFGFFNLLEIIEFFEKN